MLCWIITKKRWCQGADGKEEPALNRCSGKTGWSPVSFSFCRCQGVVLKPGGSMSDVYILYHNFNWVLVGAWGLAVSCWPAIWHFWPALTSLCVFIHTPQLVIKLTFTNVWSVTFILWEHRYLSQTRLHLISPTLISFTILSVSWLMASVLLALQIDMLSTECWYNVINTKKNNKIKFLCWTFQLWRMCGRQQVCIDYITCSLDQIQKNLAHLPQSWCVDSATCLHGLPV